MSDVIPADSDILPPSRAKLVAGSAISAIIPRDLEEAFRLARWVCAARLAPKSYETNGQADPGKVVLGIMKAMEVGFPPITGLAVIAPINNRMSIYAEGAVSLIQASGRLDKMLVEEIGAAPGSDTETAKFSSDFGIRVTMWRKGQSEPYVGEFTVGDAKRAHLWMDPKRDPWCKYPKRQMKWRAFGFASRDGFADCLMGLSIREEVEDLPPEAPAKTDTGFLDDTPLMDQIPAEQRRSPDSAGGDLNSPSPPAQPLKPGELGGMGEP